MRFRNSTKLGAGCIIFTFTVIIRMLHYTNNNNNNNNNKIIIVLLVHGCGTGGSMRACQAAGPGSIPGWDRFSG